MDYCFFQRYDLVTDRLGLKTQPISLVASEDAPFTWATGDHRLAECSPSSHLQCIEGTPASG